MDLKLLDVKPADLGKLAPCGIICLGCDQQTDESFEAAKTLVKIWEGFNMQDVGVAFGMDPEGVERTLETLKKYITIKEEMGSCPGCYVGGKGPCAICAIINCAKAKGYWTCAECDEYNPDSEYPCPHVATKVSSPFDSKGVMFALVCKRYNKNNIENLKRCREIGYPAFVSECKAEIGNGWRTWQIISKEDVLCK
ncbi:MAG: DUF3795 domain-containing protein [Proteobacteria bacterium]|nr:DUF3795 domain-containing protein [Pseudomonadota bacterium]